MKSTADEMEKLTTCKRIKFDGELHEVVLK